MAKKKYSDSVLLSSLLFQVHRSINMLQAHYGADPKSQQVVKHLRTVINTTREGRRFRKAVDCFNHKATVIPAGNQVQVSNCSCHRPLTVLKFDEDLEVAVTPKQLAQIVNSAIGNRVIHLEAKHK